ncbi:unnamed protein product [Adineta steineri]|uniref:Insulin-like domain-containing protein n=1 Tax=Adineta steineri TaxID=433720 RepID=A0A814FD92_9BILA|nr:unnamed protein product [Adineta steineri]CAF0981410.1 unnamed protein product [Adineta steineri]CAF1095342.1 unnamed protein product [Adineta steineri]
MMISSFPFILLIILNAVNQNGGHPTPLSSLNINCTVQHDTHSLTEDEKVTIRGKLFKVEDCNLQRAYQACGTQLWFMLNIVCGAVESQKQGRKFKNHHRRFAQEKLLSEACCQNTCTITEMTRYCPSV